MFSGFSDMLSTAEVSVAGIQTDLMTCVLVFIGIAGLLMGLDVILGVFALRLARKGSPWKSKTFYDGDREGDGYIGLEDSEGATRKGWTGIHEVPYYSGDRAKGLVSSSVMRHKGEK